MNPCSVLALGAPNTGKSTLLASIANIVGPENVALIALRPKEKNSFGYVQYGTGEVHVITDRNWQPDLEEYQAEGYIRLLKMLKNELYDSKTLKAVIVDPLTDVVELSSHLMLADAKVSSPKDLPGGKNASIGYFTTARKKMVNLIKAGTELTVAPYPKFFLTAVHTKPIQDENIVKPEKTTADVKARGVRFHGEVVPLIEGNYKFDLAGDFDLKLYTHVDVPRGQVTKTEFQVQVIPDKDRFAGISLAPALDVKYLANDLEVVFKAIEGALK